MYMRQEIGKRSLKVNLVVLKKFECLLINVFFSINGYNLENIINSPGVFFR